MWDMADSSRNWFLRDRSQSGAYGIKGYFWRRNDDNDYPSLFSSIKIGLDYLQDKCDAVLMAPVNVPMFKASTVRKPT